MIDINTLIGKPYDKEAYHCWSFIEEVLDVPTLKDVHVDTANDDIEKYINRFTEIDKPVDYCLVLIGKNHIGIWYNGGIYHNDKRGVRYEPLRVLKFTYPSFKYFKVNK